jgi:hypothetical protein
MTRETFPVRWLLVIPAAWLLGAASCGSSSGGGNTSAGDAGYEGSTGSSSGGASSGGGSSGGSGGSSGGSSSGGSSGSSGGSSSGSSSGGSHDGGASSSSGGGQGDAGGCSDDGAGGAPTGTTIAYPHLLDGYMVRSPCKVAGVDYPVGVTAGKTLASPTTLTSNPAITVSNGVVRCTGAASVTMDSIDFTGYTIYNGSDGCQQVTITNSKFACPSSWNASAPFAFINDQLPGSFTLKYDELYGDGCGTWPNDLSDPVSLSDVVFQYNLMRHMPERHVSAGGPGNIDYRYNLIDQPLTQAGAHENYLQFGGGAAGNVVVQFNTTYNDNVNGAEGFQFYTNGTGSFQSITFTNNTMIAADSDAGQMSMTYMIHGDCHAESDCSTTITTIAGTAVDSDNYFDPTGAYGIYYGGSFDLAGAVWSNSGNVNMVSGAAVSP